VAATGSFVEIIYVDCLTVYNRSLISVCSFSRDAHLSSCEPMKRNHSGRVLCTEYLPPQRRSPTDLFGQKTKRKTGTNVSSAPRVVTSLKHIGVGEAPEGPHAVLSPKLHIYPNKPVHNIYHKLDIGLRLSRE